MRVAPRPALVALALALAAAAAGLWWWTLREPATPLPPAVAVAPAPPAVVVQQPPASAPAGPRHPVAPDDAASAGDSPADLAGAVATLLGRGAALALLQTDGFVERIVATVDNLAGRAAPPRLWPLVPAPGRFTTAETAGGAAVIGADNAARYAAHLALLERIEPGTAARLYRQAYPDFQRAYLNLGYPGAHFNDRLVDVIDLLLAAPAVAPPVAVQLPPIGGPVQPRRPWVMYVYADAGLQERPIGQRILLRLDPAQRERVRAWLGAFRREIAAR